VGNMWISSRANSRRRCENNTKMEFEILGYGHGLD
jgi:hypothetical protein